MDICICITESLCHTPETQHCKSTIPQYKIKIKLKKIFLIKKKFNYHHKPSGLNIYYLFIFIMSYFYIYYCIVSIGQKPRHSEAELSVQRELSVHKAEITV